MSRISDVLDTVCELTAVTAQPLAALSQNARLPSAGPSLSDSIYAKLFACFVQDLPDARESRVRLVREYTEANPDVAKWLARQLTRPDGRRDLEALLFVEGLR